MKTLVGHKVAKVRQLMVQKLEDRGFKEADLSLFDDFDLSMLLDGYSPDEVTTLRKLYF